VLDPGVIDMLSHPTAIVETMNEQLPLIGTDDRPWVLDPHTRRVGLDGLRQARAALAVSRRATSGHEGDGPAPVEPAAA
jgi:hypothetical protein